MEKKSIEELKELIIKNGVPEHIAVIMDGNGRWGKMRKLPRSAGHKEGMNRVIDIVEASVDIGLKHLTLFAFSTENWKRPEKEVSTLMDLLVIFVKRELNRLKNNDVKLKVLGDTTPLPAKSRKAVEKAVEETASNNGLVLNIALNYGGQSDIVRGVKNALIDIQKGILEIDDLDEEKFSDYLWTKGQPDVDLLIRPSGEQRISNFLLYQIAYGELYFSNILWPDFREREYYLAILDFQGRNRRFGGI